MKNSTFKPPSPEKVKELNEKKRQKAFSKIKEQKATKCTPKHKKPVQRNSGRTKLPTVKSMRNKCDKLLSPIIKTQYPECFLKGAKSCNFYSQVGHHHIKKSRSSALRYDLENIIPLCNSCHMMLHQNESKWVLELIEKKGIEWAQSLKEKDVMVKTDVHFYIANYERLKAIYDELI